MLAGRATATSRTAIPLSKKRGSSGAERRTSMIIATRPSRRPTFSAGPSHGAAIVTTCILGEPVSREAGLHRRLDLRNQHRVGHRRPLWLTFALAAGRPAHPGSRPAEAVSRPAFHRANPLLPVFGRVASRPAGPARSPRLRGRRRGAHHRVGPARGPAAPHQSLTVETRARDRCADSHLQGPGSPDGWFPQPDRTRRSADMGTVRHILPTEEDSDPSVSDAATLAILSVAATTTVARTELMSRGAVI